MWGGGGGGGDEPTFHSGPSFARVWYNQITIILDSISINVLMLGIQTNVDNKQ